jgi:uncharacterized protein YgiM (DUF1202 family)
MSAPPPPTAPPPAAPQVAPGAPTEEPAPAPAPRQAPRPARWLDRMTGLLIAASLGLAAASAVPSLLHAAGVELPVAEAPAPTGPRIAVPHPPPEILSHPESPFGDDDSAGGQRIHRDPNSKLPPRFTDEPNPWVPAEPAEEEPEPHRDPLEYALPSRAVILGGALSLHEQPLDSARVVGVVHAGQKVTLLTERGPWAIVMYNVGEEQHAGWAKKSEIAVR